MEATVLYGMLLDRMSLSSKNDWYDDTGRVYIYYTLEEICADMTYGRDKAMKLLAELDTGRDIGLIERVKQGQGRPAKIYVKRFALPAGQRCLNKPRSIPCLFQRSIFSTSTR